MLIFCVVFERMLSIMRKVLLKTMSSFIVVFIIMLMLSTDLLSNASSSTLYNDSSINSANSLQSLHGDDGNSLFEVGRSGAQTYMTLKNQTSTSNYVELSVSAISSSGTIINTNSYSGILPSGNIHALMSNNPNAVSYQVIAVMYSNSMLSNWTAVVDNTSTIQASDSKSLAIVTRSGNFAYLSLKNQTISAHYYDINIDAISSSGTNVGNVNTNGILAAGTINTILNMNFADTYQLVAQMWNNTTPTGTLLSNWTAIA